MTSPHFPYRHFPIPATNIAVKEDAPRGVTVQRFQGRVWITLHNGCERGNMVTKLTNAEALELAHELIVLARQGQ